MHCILCGKELDADFQICGDCAIKAFERDPLWHCRNYLVGDSIPDILSKKNTLVLSLGHDRESFIDDINLKDDVRIPEKPLKADAEKMFWKINMYLNHMGAPLYMEDIYEIEPTLDDLDNMSHIMNSALALHEHIGSADEETLSRLASVYFYSMTRLGYLRGISPEDRNALSNVIEERMRIYLSEGEKIMPHRGHIITNQAYLAQKAGDYRGALDLYRMVPEYDSNPRALAGMGRAYEGLEMIESADDSYTQALRIDDAWIPAWQGKASAALSGKRWGAALQFISKAIALRPNMASLYILKGEIFAGQGLTNEADRAYQKAIGLKHGESGWLKRAELMYDAGRWGAALQFIERYLFHFPDDEEGIWWRDRIKQAVDKGNNEW